MGRAPCCDKANVKKGPWSPEEDAKLKAYIEEKGTGSNWIALPQKIGLKRCGKSCRLRWLNYLRPNIKHGSFTEDEDKIICSLYISIGSRWSVIAAQLPGRTDNDIKNYWNTKLKKKILGKQKNNGGNGSSNNSPALSSSAIERMQLHMHLQRRNSPLSFYNNPLLWPKVPTHQQPHGNAAVAADGEKAILIPSSSNQSGEFAAAADSLFGSTRLENLNVDGTSSSSAILQGGVTELVEEVSDQIDGFAENLALWDAIGIDENYQLDYGIDLE